MSLQAIILAGGLGSRMKTISGEKPKALLPIGDSHFLDVQLRWLKHQGITNVVLSLGHKSEMIDAELKKQKKDWPEFLCVYDGDKLLGTGGAVYKAIKEVPVNNSFFITYGDTILRPNPVKMMNQHILSKAKVTMAAHKNHDVGDKSNIRIDAGKVLYKKTAPTSDMHYIDYGIMAMDKKYFLDHSPSESFDLVSILEPASANGEVMAYEVFQPFFEVGSPKGYENFCKAYTECQGSFDALEKY